LRRLRWVGHVPHIGETISVYRVLAGKPEGKRPLVISRRRLEDNIKMDLQEVGWGMDWSDVAEIKCKVASICKCGNEPTGSIKSGEFPTS
jgi:hypothetical protein